MTTAPPPAPVSADELRAWMAARRLSVYALAHMLGRHHGTVAIWLNGRTPPDLRLTLAGLDATQRQP